MASRLSDRLRERGTRLRRHRCAPRSRARRSTAARSTRRCSRSTRSTSPRSGTSSASRPACRCPKPPLCESPVKCVNPDGPRSSSTASGPRSARAVPVGVEGGALQMLCGEPVAQVELDAASARLGVAVPAVHRSRGPAGRGPPGDLRTADAAALVAAVRARRGRRAGAPLADRRTTKACRSTRSAVSRCCRAVRTPVAPAANRVGVAPTLPGCPTLPVRGRAAAARAAPPAAAAPVRGVWGQ